MKQDMKGKKEPDGDEKKVAKVHSFRKGAKGPSKKRQLSAMKSLKK